MTLNFGPMTRVEKLMKSLQNHIFMTPENNTHFLEQSRRMLEDVYLRNSDALLENQDSNTQAQDSNQSNMDNTIASLAI